MREFALGLVITLYSTLVAAAGGEVRSADPVRVDNHQLPALEAADFTQAAPALSPASAHVALKLEAAGLDRDFWPIAIHRDMHAAAGRIHLLHPRWSRASSQRAARGGRVFYFLLVPQDPATAGDAYVMYASEEGSNKRPARFMTTGEPWSIPSRGSNPVPFNGRLSFAVVPWDDSLAVIYRDRGGVFARRLNVNGESLTFDRESWPIASAPAAVGAYQILARTDAGGNVHLLWGMAAADRQSSLHYCRIAASAQNTCRQPMLLSASGGRDYVNLMVQGDRIYAAWTDDRYASRRWDTLRNTSKLMIAASTDGGQSFTTPVSINRPKKNADRAVFALTLPAADDGVLVFWAPKRKDPGDLDQQTYHAGWLDGDLENFRVGASPVPGQQIFDTYERAVLKHHEYLGEKTD